MIGRKITIDRHRPAGSARWMIAAALLAFVLSPTPVRGQFPGLDEDETRWLRMTCAVIGMSGSHSTGYLGTVGGLYAGEVDVPGQGRVWSLEGMLTKRHDRIALSAATLVATGNSGIESFGKIVLLVNGEQIRSWEFHDTEQFRGIPPEWLLNVADNKPVMVGGMEAEAYINVLKRAHHTSWKAFGQAARKDIGFTHLFNEPEKYRGTPVRVTGRLLRINRYDPPFEASIAGVGDLYEAWVFPELLGVNPYCVIFTEWDPALPRELLAANKIDKPIYVTLDGYFFKKFRYKAIDKFGTERDAPLLIGNSLRMLQQAPDASVRSEWMPVMLVGFVTIFAALLIGVIALTFWFRRNDDTIRKRLLSRIPEFSLPPADVPPPHSYVPMATPVAKPVNGAHPHPALTHHPRTTFPTAPPDRGEKTDGDGSQDKPPGEDAGA